MENTNIQFFTDDQTRAVTEFAMNLYEEHRDEQRKILKASDEFKKAKEELKGGEYDQKLQKDKTALIAGFKSRVQLLNAMKESFGENGSQKVLELLTYPHWYIGGKDKDSIDLPKLPSIDVNNLPSYIVRDFAQEGKTETQLIVKIDEKICENLSSEVIREKFQHTNNIWTAREQVKAIVATMPACDESQAIDKIVEKMPYEEVNKVGPKEVSECSKVTAGEGMEDPVSSN